MKRLNEGVPKRDSFQKNGARHSQPTNSKSIKNICNVEAMPSQAGFSHEWPPNSYHHPLPPWLMMPNQTMQSNESPFFYGSPQLDKFNSTRTCLVMPGSFPQMMLGGHRLTPMYVQNQPPSSSLPSSSAFMVPTIVPGHMEYIPQVNDYKSTYIQEYSSADGFEINSTPRISVTGSTVSQSPDAKSFLDSSPVTTNVKLVCSSKVFVPGSPFCGGGSDSSRTEISRNVSSNSLKAKIDPILKIDASCQVHLIKTDASSNTESLQFSTVATNTDPIKEPKRMTDLDSELGNLYRQFCEHQFVATASKKSITSKMDELKWQELMVTKSKEIMKKRLQSLLADCNELDNKQDSASKNQIFEEVQTSQLHPQYDQRSSDVLEHDTRVVRGIRSDSPVIKNSPKNSRLPRRENTAEFLISVPSTTNVSDGNLDEVYFSDDESTVPNVKMTSVSSSSQKTNSSIGTSTVTNLKAGAPSLYSPVICSVSPSFNDSHLSSMLPGIGSMASSLNLGLGSFAPHVSPLTSFPSSMSGLCSNGSISNSFPLGLSSSPIDFSTLNAYNTGHWSTMNTVGCLPFPGINKSSLQINPDLSMSFIAKVLSENETVVQHIKALLLQANPLFANNLMALQMATYKELLLVQKRQKEIDSFVMQQELHNILAMSRMPDLKPELNGKDELQEMQKLNILQKKDNDEEEKCKLDAKKEVNDDEDWKQMQGQSASKVSGCWNKPSHDPPKEERRTECCSNELNFDRNRTEADSPRYKETYPPRFKDALPPRFKALASGNNNAVKIHNTTKLDQHVKPVGATVDGVTRAAAQGGANKASFTGNIATTDEVTCGNKNSDLSPIDFSAAQSTEEGWKKVNKKKKLIKISFQSPTDQHQMQRDRTLLEQVTKKKTGKAAKTKSSK